MEPGVLNSAAQDAFQEVQAWVGEPGFGRRIDCPGSQGSRHQQEGVEQMDSGVSAGSERGQSAEARATLN
jgi:hypothetical protein